MKRPSGKCSTGSARRCSRRYLSGDACLIPNTSPCPLLPVRGVEEFITAANLSQSTGTRGPSDCLLFFNVAFGHENSSRWSQRRIKRRLAGVTVVQRGRKKRRAQIGLIVEGFEEIEAGEAAVEAMGRRVAAGTTPELSAHWRAVLILDPVHREHHEAAVAGWTPGRRLVLDDRWIDDRFNRRRQP